MLRVTADTNILISGLNFRGGKPFQFLDLARAGQNQPHSFRRDSRRDGRCASAEIPFHAEDISEARMRVQAMARTVKPAVTLDVIKEDPPDNRILECAVAAGSDYLVTGDKDLLRLKSYDSIRILSVSDFLDHAGHEPRPTPCLPPTLSVSGGAGWRCVCVAASAGVRSLYPQAQRCMATGSRQRRP